VDDDGVSEWICELNGNSHPETMVYCLTMGGGFPASSYWPEYYHCAYPAEYQAEQDWLLLKVKRGRARFLWCIFLASPNIRIRAAENHPF